jgi:hypothetical protein
MKADQSATGKAGLIFLEISVRSLIQEDSILALDIREAELAGRGSFRSSDLANGWFVLGRSQDQR